MREMQVMESSEEGIKAERILRVQAQPEAVL